MHARFLALAATLLTASLGGLLALGPSAAALACTTPEMPVGACAGTNLDGCAVWAEGDLFRACVPDCAPAASCAVDVCTDGGIGTEFRGDCHLLVRDDDPYLGHDCGDNAVAAGFGEYRLGCYPTPTVHQCGEPGHYEIRWGSGGMPCWGFWMDVEVYTAECDHEDAVTPAVHINDGRLGCTYLHI